MSEERLIRAVVFEKNIALNSLECFLSAVPPSHEPTARVVCSVLAWVFVP